MKRFIIIGAGPVGSYAALLLAEKGHDVTVYEKKHSVGTPIQCTGIVTSEIDKLIDIPDSVVDNRISGITTNSSKESITFKLKKEEYILCRKKFDNFILKKAKSKGVSFFYSHELISVSEEKILVRDTKNNQIKEIYFDILIGADGPLSIVRRFLNPNAKILNWIGIQAVAKYSLDERKYDTYFGHDFPNFFGWAVPEGKGYSRVGVAAERDAKSVFVRFLAKLGIDSSSIKDMQGGLIPKYSPSLKVLRGNIALIGDAATHVKATTGGGIIPGMKGSIEVISALQKNKKILFNRDLKLHKELFAHLILRETFNQFSDSKYDSLLDMCRTKRLSEVISAFNRDQVLRLGMRVLIAQPRLFLYSRYVLRSLMRTRVKYI